MRSCPLTVLCLSASLGVGVVAGCGGSDKGHKQQELPAGVAAKVGAKTISEAAVVRQLDTFYQGNHETAKAWGPPTYAACIKAHRPLDRSGKDASFRRQCVVEHRIQRGQAASALLEAIWLTEEIKRRGIDISAELRKGAAATRRQLALRRAKAGPRESPVNLELTLRTSIEYAKLRAAMPASETEIRDYGNANGDVFLDSERRQANILQAANKRNATRARAELDRGVSWSRVLDEYGVKPFGAHWSGTHTIRKATAPADAFGRALFTQKIGKLTGPINTLNGWFLFEVVSVRPPKSTQLSPTAHDTVAATIRSHKLERLLHDRYARRTQCAKPYQIPEVPQCV